MDLIFLLFFIGLLVVIIKMMVKTLKKDLSQIDRESSPIKHVSPYHYGRKRYLMTQAENSFFIMLTDTVGAYANVFPQVRLSALLFRTQGIERRYWHAALARINQKSVDYVLCNKLTGEILLVIELDDPTHDTSMRQKRDADINEMLEEAGVPFLRFRDVGRLTAESLAIEIYEIMPSIFSESNGSSHKAAILKES